MPSTAPYCGRFAPSPTGPLHAGSLVAALASWLDARAHAGQWLVRIEDIDPPRCQAGADQIILGQLARCGLLPDAPPVWQSQRHHHYAQALEQLIQQGLSYACGCTRKEIDLFWQSQGLSHQRHVERPYPGTCRHGLHGKPLRSWRFALEKTASQAIDFPRQFTGRTSPAINGYELRWHDRRLGWQQQHVAEAAGDFVLQRSDGLYSYQLAVVVDDALQGITDIVRGADLTDNTARQLLLQHSLGTAHPQYFHTPLVLMPDGEKLSKQHGAPAVDLENPITALNNAALALNLQALSPDTPLTDALPQWVKMWQDSYNTERD